MRVPIVSAQNKENNNGCHIEGDRWRERQNRNGRAWVLLRCIGVRYFQKTLISQVVTPTDGYLTVRFITGSVSVGKTSVDIQCHSEKPPQFKLIRTKYGGGIPFAKLTRTRGNIFQKNRDPPKKVTLFEQIRHQMGLCGLFAGWKKPTEQTNTCSLFLRNETL